VHSGLALTLEALGRNEEAERELREAIRLDDGKSLPGSDPRIELGAFLLRQGRLNEALTALRAAVKARPDSARAHFELGRAMLQVDRLEDASGQLRQAIALNANYAPAHLLLGKVYFRMGCRAEGALQTRLGQKLTAPQP
jgi:superkiller protein 3